MTDYALFESMFRANYPALCREAAFMLADRDEAEDLVQELFVDLWNDSRYRLSQLKPAYLRTAVRNRCISRLRRCNRLVSIDDPAIEQQTATLPDDNRPEVLPAADRIDSLRRAVEQALPDRCRMVFFACKFEGMSYAEAARTLGISVKTVENQMSKALRTVRQIVAQRPDLTLATVWCFIQLLLLYR